MKPFKFAKNTFHKVPVGFRFLNSQGQLSPTKKLQVALVNFQTIVKNILRKAVRSRDVVRVDLLIPIGMATTIPCKMFCEETSRTFKEIVGEYNLDSFANIVEAFDVVLVDSLSSNCCERGSLWDQLSLKSNALVCAVFHY